MDKDALFQHFVTFSASVHQLTTELTKDVRADSVTQAQYKMLEYIAVRQPLTLSEISDCLSMSLPNTSRELKKLMEKGLCRKVSISDDRRKQHILLTPAGEEMMKASFGLIRERFLQLSEPMTEDELRKAAEALTVLQAGFFREHTTP